MQPYTCCKLCIHHVLNVKAKPSVSNLAVKGVGECYPNSTNN
ncbi:hypothetical protein [Pseudomonas phage vB_Pa-PAC2]